LESKLFYGKIKHVINIKTLLKRKYNRKYENQRAFLHELFNNRYRIENTLSLANNLNVEGPQ
jgi:hypothetical protein